MTLKVKLISYVPDELVEVTFPSWNIKIKCEWGIVLFVEHKDILEI